MRISDDPKADAKFNGTESVYDQFRQAVDSPDVRMSERYMRACVFAFSKASRQTTETVGDLLIQAYLLESYETTLFLADQLRTWGERERGGGYNRMKGPRTARPPAVQV